MSCLALFVQVEETMCSRTKTLLAKTRSFEIHQRGVQWKQGVVVYIILYIIFLYDTTPIHCTPLRLHPPLMKTQS